jgi:TIR domain
MGRGSCPSEKRGQRNRRTNRSIDFVGRLLEHLFMATLYEYFLKDAGNNLTFYETWQFTRGDKSIIVDGVIARLHYDFDANAKYVSFYLPASVGIECPEAFLLNKLGEILDWPRTKFGASSGFGLDPATRMDGRDLAFTGRIYIYSERKIAEDLKQRLLAEARLQGDYLVFRGTEYVMERNQWEKPRAFIAHDFRDQTEIAQPLAVQLQKLMCPVWFSEFSLKVGDSLRESIENGLRQCPKCVLIITPRFLSNEGWSRREYDAIFTRELVERQKVILPVWHEVIAEDVYKYSPILADRFAVQWSRGLEDVARKLLNAIESSPPTAVVPTQAGSIGENSSELSPLGINIGEDGPFYDVPKSDLYSFTKRIKIELRNTHRVKAAANCKVQVTNISPDTGSRGPWLLAEHLSLSAGDAVYLPLVRYKEARQPAVSDYSDTSIEVCVDGGRFLPPLMQIETENIIAIRATATDLPYCEVQLIVWKDEAGKLRIKIRNR